MSAAAYTENVLEHARRKREQLAPYLAYDDELWALVMDDDVIELDK